MKMEKERKIKGKREGEKKLERFLDIGRDAEIFKREHHGR